MLVTESRILISYMKGIFALFLARTLTEFTFNIGHFLIILLFHSLLATFQVSVSLIFDLF